jgi:prepilin-type N-terminal cleavage/methylation domain-containing protein
MRQRLRGGFSLVEMLVVLVVIAVLAMFLFPRYLGGGKTPDGKNVRSPMQRARSVECQNYLSQAHMAYQAATASATDDEGRPRSIMDLKTYGLTDSMMACPVGKEPYQFDPATGRVRCVHPGHESY